MCQALFKRCFFFFFLHFQVTTHFRSVIVNWEQFCHLGGQRREECYWRLVGRDQGCHSTAYDTRDSLPLPHKELFSAECQQCPDGETLIRMKWNKIE